MSWDHHHTYTTSSLPMDLGLEPPEVGREMLQAAPDIWAPGGNVTDKRFEGILHLCCGWPPEFIPSKWEVENCSAWLYVACLLFPAHWNVSLQWFLKTLLVAKLCCLQYSSRWKDFLCCLVLSQPGRDPMSLVGRISNRNPVFPLHSNHNRRFLLYIEF